MYYIFRDLKMPRPRSARSDNSDADMEGLAEQELVKLQRQFRIMQGDKEAYTEESQNMIRKQKYDYCNLCINIYFAFSYDIFYVK